jgi:hypothetical protein
MRLSYPLSNRNYPFHSIIYSMRITRQILLKIAEDTVAQRLQTNRNLLAVYLTGSVARDVDPVLGGTADIDLVFLHEYDPPANREIIRLTEDIHLDILHHTRREYSQVRELRVHPQMGPVIYGCQILHDPRHFLDFTQASVRAHFLRADNVLQRSRTQLESARRVWFSFQFYDAQPGLGEVRRYLDAVNDAAGAIATVGGGLLFERRYLSDFFEYANQLGRPGLYAGLLGLLGTVSISVEDLKTWLSDWELAYSAVGRQENYPQSLHPYRLNYYKRAIMSLLESDRSMDAVWPLTSTWLEIVENLPKNSDCQQIWENAFLQLGLLGNGFQERIQALDAYLDLIDETLESWGASQGI